jgi:hypothetical protein
MHLTETVLNEGEALNRELAGRVATLFADKLPGLPARKRAFIATIVVELMSAMLIISARRDADEGKAIMDETKTLLRLYLASQDLAEEDGKQNAKPDVTSPRKLRSR